MGGTEKLERVMWRLRKITRKPNMPYYNELQQAVIYECGHTPQTYYNIKRALVKLGWIKSHSSKRFILTNKDLEQA